MLNRNRLVNVNVVLGVLTILASLFLWRRGTALSVNGWITGAVIIISALLEVRRPAFRFVIGAAGVWLIASMFAWPNYSSPAVWVNAMVGAAVALVSLVGPETADMISS